MSIVAKNDISPPRVPRRVVLLSIVGFWLFYFLINSLRASLLHWGHQWVMIQARGAVSLVGMGLVYLSYLALRRVEHKSIGTLVATAFLVAVPVSLLYAAVNSFAFSMFPPMETSGGSMPPHEDLSSALVVSELALGWYFFVVSWSALYVALSYAARVRAAERNVALYRAEAQSAQLRALRYQINPHFLFNTLNSLSTLILGRRNDEAEKMLMNLAAFFRASLTGEPTEDVSLAEEIRMQRLYLSIEESRFPDRLRVDIEVPAELQQASIPGFILQPLVENAIKYAVARSLRPVTIRIAAQRRGDDLLLVVEDDGQSLLPVTNGGIGVGLGNVRDRLTARFGEAASCISGGRPDGGFRVALTMPLQLQRSLAAS